MAGLETVTDIKTPKTRVNNTSNVLYSYVGVAKEVSTKTTEIGWAWYRITLATGDVDWAQKNGVPTKEFVFNGIKAEAAALTYDEA